MAAVEFFDLSKKWPRSLDSMAVWRTLAASADFDA